jgi:hypothetical protein
MHWHHRFLSSALAVVALSVCTVPAAMAGGWAVTTLDEVPATLKAGETYPIGYTVRQHGQTPFLGSETGIEIRSSSNARQRFNGVAQGAPGHYVAQVRFPEAGEWQWFADQKPFEIQPLGKIAIVAALPVVAQPAVAAQPVVAQPAATAPAPPVVAAAVAPAPAVIQPAQPANEWPMPVRLGLPLAAAIASALFAWRLVVFMRAPRITPAH